MKIAASEQASARARARRTDRGDDLYTAGICTATISQPIDGRIPPVFRSFVRSYVRLFVRSHPRVDAGAINEREDAPGGHLLLHEPHSGHYTRRRDEWRSVFCFLSLLILSISLSFSSLLRRRRRRVLPLRSRGSDCSRETGGAARSTNGVPAFTERHLAPTRAQRGRRPSDRGNARPATRSSFHPCAAAHPHPVHPHRRHRLRHYYYPSSGGSTCVLRLRSFGVLTFDIGVLWQD